MANVSPAAWWNTKTNEQLSRKEYLSLQEVTRMEVELAAKQAQINEMMNDMHRVAETPFEETNEFRDFVVWLCGFTDRSTPATLEDWEGLRNRTKQIAAKFALKAREDARTKYTQPYQHELFPNPISASGYTTVSTSAAPVFTTTSGLERDKTYTYKELIS